MKKLFVTGTDTDVGKTFATSAILNQLKQRRFSTAGFKPVAAGCNNLGGALRNDDALLLQRESTVELTYEQVNPCAYEQPIAPHIAAESLGQRIDLDPLNQAVSNIERMQPDYLVAEGAGGWRLPLTDGIYLSDFVKQQQMQVIMVVGLRLGCLNHALLTAEAIQNDGLKLVGWIANQVDWQMPYADDNLNYLHKSIQAPFLGKIPRLSGPAEAFKYLDLTPIL
ncbi:Dethiobiotin synthase [Saliniradius amylolyticus]|uniref:ATP-dependent dethiobiotin synthetase BioD n=1 Tax=Saliniradius amylolyticus TaxID=2183582 RepID=A0A2S2E2E8_9ALTE|nr:dethiobiotin synthase [Saliniradius amylolyticus]AWL11814.1 Dethiobiotin synthase [Saliniradius amylolyticus]